ncbi:tetratricopeptide repeat protein [Sunxiuqinia elliptica]|uniref:Tetratricopeptide repeat-containing protein n=1 Tax=Sunxiuqinia elliptica TaxID=655355 RepID=A0A1I2IN95_9BACT|nr:tetratricopeptide repeat protein [Sunxiuqinia elliptica]SFF43734.1 Tetratricopeptide repeat-containing protein [Sunxiuqinia elliptica]
MRQIVISILIITLSLNSFSQEKSDKVIAYEKAVKAIKLMDNGDIDKSIKMLRESQQLDPENYNYPYETAYAYYLKNDYKKAIQELEKVLTYKENSDQCYTLLGNIWDMEREPEKAIAIYNQGLEKFPNSGRLHFEKGNVLEVLKKYDEALNIWEEGILRNPPYPSNYHTASIYFCKYTTEKIWGILYGELFANIERGSKKTEEISKLLYETYQSAITIKSDTEVGVSFSKAAQFPISEKADNLQIPFSIPYEMTMALSVIPEANENELGIKSFSNIRTAFITEWYDKNRNTEYPNILFDWHKKLIDLEHFESYNYWLFMKGNEKEFEEWYNQNSEQFDKFIEWFSSNPMKINDENKFHRTQYE